MRGTMKPSAVAVDIDSTLADTRHRASMINTADRGRTDWLAYAKACADDLPTATVSLVNLLAERHQILILTSRPLGAMVETKKWLDAQSVEYNMLIMDSKERGRVEFKVETLRGLQVHFNVKLLLEDAWDIGQAVQDELGIPTVVVRSYAPSVEMRF